MSTLPTIKQGAHLFKIMCDQGITSEQLQKEAIEKGLFAVFCEAVASGVTTSCDLDSFRGQLLLGPRKIALQAYLLDLWNLSDIEEKEDVIFSPNIHKSIEGLCTFPKDIDLNIYAAAKNDTNEGNLLNKLFPKDIAHHINMNEKEVLEILIPFDDLLGSMVQGICEGKFSFLKRYYTMNKQLLVFCTDEDRQNLKVLRLFMADKYKFCLDDFDPRRPRLAGATACLAVPAQKSVPA